MGRTCKSEREHWTMTDYNSGTEVSEDDQGQGEHAPAPISPVALLALIIRDAAYHGLDDDAVLSLGWWQDDPFPRPWSGRLQRFNARLKTTVGAVRRGLEAMVAAPVEPDQVSTGGVRADGRAWEPLNELRRLASGYSSAFEVEEPEPAEIVDVCFEVFDEVARLRAAASDRTAPQPRETADAVPLHSPEERALQVLSGNVKSELLSCPFCGNVTFLDVQRDATVVCGDEDCWVKCETCEACGPRSRFGCRDDEAEDPGIDLEVEARDHWNDRVSIPMILHCPRCQLLHVDAPAPEKGWENPPHRSHLCHGCQTVWRPADVPTVGVAGIETRGNADTWP